MALRLAQDCLSENPSLRPAVPVSSENIVREIWIRPHACILIKLCLTRGGFCLDILPA